MTEPYTYIIFRASEVKDLAVDEPANQRRDVREDPAVIGVSLLSVLFSILCTRHVVASDETIDGCNEQMLDCSESAKPLWISRCLPSEHSINPPASRMNGC